MASIPPALSIVPSFENAVSGHLISCDADAIVNPNSHSTSRSIQPATAGDALKMRYLAHRRRSTVESIEGRRSLPPGCLLNRLEPNDRADLLALGFARRYQAGATIIHEGDEGDSVYVLLSGHVKVSVTATDGQQSVLCVLGPGELLGEFESIDEDEGPRTADNVALEVVECRVLRGVEFRAFLESHPRQRWCCSARTSAASATPTDAERTLWR